MIPFSVLDLSPVVEGATPADALRNTLSLAQHAEELGFRRYWLAEHHNMMGIASAATSIVIGHVAGGTKTIRVGSGGIMLPNHSPLVIAEQFGTLESLYPGRIDLGLGRAPGSDQLTAYALRRDNQEAADRFPQDVVELQALLGPLQAGQRIRAVPGFGTKVPLYILGSSLFGAQLAGMLGLPYAFASHFAPDALMEALAIYRQHFTASEQLDRPYAMAGVNVIAADDPREAKKLFTSLQTSFMRLRRGMPGQLPPPVDSLDSDWSISEQASAAHSLRYAYVGTRDSVRRGLQNFVAQTGVDEVIISGHIYDHAARLKSFEIAADACKAIGELAPASAA